MHDAILTGVIILLEARSQGGISLAPHLIPGLQLYDLSVPSPILQVVRQL